MNLVKVLAVIAVIAVITVIAVLLMGQFEQTKPVADAATGLGNQATDYVQKNIPTVVAAGGAVTAIGGAALSKISAAKQQTQQVTTAATDQINKIKDEKDALKTQITDAQETAKQQITQATDLQKQAETKANELETANKTLTGQLTGMQEMHNNFVAQLTSGAQTVIDPATNQTYKLITLEKTVVK